MKVCSYNNKAVAQPKTKIELKSTKKWCRAGAKEAYKIHENLAQLA